MNNEFLPSFLDAVFTNGRIIAQCGFCGQIHICLDDPREALPSIQINVEDTGKPKTKEDVQAAIRGFEEQQEFGINSCYDPERLIDFLHRIPDVEGEEHIPLVDRVAQTFRCDPEEAQNLISQYPPAVDPPSYNVRPHYGAENLGVGTLDGKTVVEGCCDHVLLKYQHFIWTERGMIARFVTAQAKAVTAEAKETESEAKKIAAAAK